MKSSRDFKGKGGISHTADAAQLSFPDSRPILDVLRPVRVESWKDEGLFRHGKFSVGQKIRFVCRVRARAFDYSARGMAEVRDIGRGISSIEVRAGKKMDALRMFNAVSGPEMRQIMANMIVREDLIGARYTAKKARYVWPQFVLDFNYGLEQMMAVQQRR